MNICWTIAGSDSGGGAGIQADLKTFNQLGVHGCTAIVSLTAQNTTAVRAVTYPSMDMIDAQLSALGEDLPPRAVKTGMLGNPEITARVADFLGQYKVPLVVDPVMVATSGGVLMEPEAKAVLLEKLLPLATVVTPNLAEVEALTGITPDSETAVADAAREMLAFGCHSVLIKGGHGDQAFSQDYWTDGETSFWLTSPRQPVGETHGSGCTLSAALAAALGLGYDLEDALVIAKAYINQGIRSAQKVGAGAAPIAQKGWPEDPRDMPWITPSAAAGRKRPQFPETGPEPLGFYPIVDRSTWLERLLPLGVKTVQLRIKDLQGAALEEEIVKAIQLARQYQARLFVNDYWELALKHGAYGVHLGQEDLPLADVARLAEAGLRLGLSTHCYGEVARAHAWRPSYMAIGPIYATQTKDMRFGPQGLDALSLWRRSLRYPLVAIGGIKLPLAAGVLAAGADSIAVITAITEAADPEGETQRWLKYLETHQRMT